ncbi:hypothetical protein ONZ45_g1662 [Pleurotus djamor]|nr:hypothetical protein ONZ45_g1662 [Pleurotus djamor]
MSNDGLPTAEDRAQYEVLRAELIKSLEKKRTIDKQLATTEARLYQLEFQYLTDTSQSSGNIIQGFDGYLRNQTVARRKYEVSDSDRLFSNSSVTLHKSIELVQEGEESSSIPDGYKQSTPGLTTVVVPPATQRQELSAQSKKARDKEYQRRKRASVTRQSTGTNSDDEQTSNRRPTKRARHADDE